MAWQQPGELREVPVPEPGPGEVLVKVGGAGACHSDLHILEMPQPELLDPAGVLMSGRKRKPKRLIAAGLPVNFDSPAQECCVASPFWGSLPELVEVVELAQASGVSWI